MSDKVVGHSARITAIPPATPIVVHIKDIEESNAARAEAKQKAGEAPCLFVGGPADGQMRIREPRAYYKFYYFDSAPLEPLSLWEVPSSHARPFKTITYVLHTIRGGHKNFYIYAPDGTSAEEVISTLVLGYRQPQLKGKS